jgi:hypothetical protein
MRKVVRSLRVVHAGPGHVHKRVLALPRLPVRKEVSVERREVEVRGHWIENQAEAIRG